MRLTHFGVAGLLGLFALANANAQQQKPSPEDMQKMTDSTSPMLPTLGRMMEVQLEAQLKVAERPETAERIATFKKNLFDALKRKGFTAEQSLQIVHSTPLPAVTSSLK